MRVGVGLRQCGFVAVGFLLLAFCFLFWVILYFVFIGALACGIVDSCFFSFPKRNKTDIIWV